MCVCVCVCMRVCVCVGVEGLLFMAVCGASSTCCESQTTALLQGCDIIQNKKCPLDSNEVEGVFFAVSSFVFNDVL